MQIQINSDKNIELTKDAKDDLKLKVEKKLARFDNLITRVEVHLSDENSDKSGLNDKKCLIEARLLNRQPIIVTDHSENTGKSFVACLNKIQRKINAIVEKMRD